MHTRPKIALVEDDEDLRHSTEDFLIASGYSVWGVGSVEAFYRRFLGCPVDIVILDLILPGESGITLLKLLQSNLNVTVIILSARDTVEDRLNALATGADRFLVKPVNLPELVANIEAAARRASAAGVLLHGAENTHDTSPAIQAPALSNTWALDVRKWQLTSPDGHALSLTAKENALLGLLMRNAGELVLKKDIATLLFGARVLNGSERLNVLMARLRKKAKSSLDIDLPIKTVHYAGYTFTAECYL